MSRYKIVMLPTNEASNICLDKIENELFINPSMTNGTRYQRQHLYIVDTEATIEVGDWFIDLPEKKLIKSKFGKHQTQYMGYDVKVTASTDASLGLPALHPETIKRYCQNPQLEIVDVVYNIGKIVDDKWYNFTNSDSYEEAKQLCQQGFNNIRLMVFWKDEHDFSDLELDWEIQDIEPQVDFNLLKDFISGLKAFGESEKYANSIRNAVLFFELEEVKRIINNLQI